MSNQTLNLILDNKIFAYDGELVHGQGILLVELPGTAVFKNLGAQQVQVRIVETHCGSWLLKLLSST